MAPIWLWTVRFGGIILFTALIFQSWRLAAADFLADAERPGSLERAITLDPDNPRYLLREAQRNLFSDNLPQTHIEEEFRQVLRLNPRSSEALMNLGLMSETRGDKENAERLLIEATSIDHTFKPIWTLANFYYRTNQQDKLLAEIRKALDLTTKPDLLFYDISHVYDLCWRIGVEPKQVLALVPERPFALVSYFSYLVSQKHVDAATEVYPRVLPFVDSASKGHQKMFANYCDQLAQLGRAEQAVQVWNTLVEKRIITSTRIEQNEAKSITNPSFSMPFDPPPFGWAAMAREGVTVAYTPGSVVFEFSGQQPDMELLQKNIPVLSDRDYVLTWEADGSGITKPSNVEDSGLKLRFNEDSKTLPVSCSPFLTQEKERACRFRIPALPLHHSLRILNMRIGWERPAGNVRLKGTVLVRSFRLAFAAHS